jgi:hypothetical protein
MRTALMALPILVLTSAATPANAYCSPPSAPSCATRYGTFDSQDDFDHCKRQMSSYQSEAQDYLSCLRREAEDLKRKSDGTIEEYNSAVDSFNRRARG